MEFEAEGNSHLSTNRSYFSMYQLQNISMVYFDNQETDDRKKVFDKYFQNKKALKEGDMAPTNYQVHSVEEEKGIQAC